MSEVTWAVVVLVVFVGIVFYLDRRAKNRGSLFTGAPTAGMRILALILGLGFGALFVAETLWMDQFHWVFPVISVAGIAYGLGATRLLQGLQRASDKNEQKDMPPDPMNGC